MTIGEASESCPLNRPSSLEVQSDPSTAWSGPWVLDPGGGKATREVSGWVVLSGNGIRVRAANAWGGGPWSPAAGIDKNCETFKK
ncbi:hypothetical protein [Candidatus Poriferisocius sp.]|uniref:hypothetical protein n=1 Tax=Candidatus Poriferisocius sp. TaxID=3101276 RepID=UPI003B029921